MTPDGFRCADSAEERAEPLYGTASFVRRWILLEQPGSWGRDALGQSQLAERVASELRRRAQRAGVRVILIRRGVRRSSDRRQCYFLRTDGRGLYQAHMELDLADDLLDVDLTPLREGGSIPGAIERERPLFLVCTHGRHDQCCSIRGNQVSRVACAQPEIDAWECSHIGGDRFAANVVCFPHGIYYGRVGADQVAELMGGYAAGSLSLEHFRGRCSQRFPVQAAEFFARRETGLTDIEALALVGSRPTPRGVGATFSLAGAGNVEVEVQVSRGARHRLTCHASGTDPIPVYELMSCKTT